MKHLEILKRLILEADEEVSTTVSDEVETSKVGEKPKNTAFEKDPMGFILKKYQGLNDILTELMTKDFKEFVDGIFIMAPKPTTFKIMLHNGQFFFLTYMKEDVYEATIQGKRYYLAGIGEKERCMMAISRLLRFGTPLKTKGPEGAEQDTRGGENTGMEGDWAANGGNGGAATPEAGTEEATASAEAGGEEENLKENKRILEAILKEARSLSANELVKPSEEIKGTRGDLLLKKIDNGEKIKMIDGQSIIIDKKKSVDFIKALRDKKYKAVTNIRFYDKNGWQHRLSHLEKTEEFGAGKGSGGGAAITAVQESSQCLVNAVRYNKGSEISESDLTDKNFARATKRIETTASLEEMVNFIKNDASWRKSLVNTANLLAKKFPGNYKFYRGSGIVVDIDKAAKSCLKYVIGKLNVNKWNPADIWMALGDLDIESIPTDTELPKLNKWMISKYKSKQLIGVSLKKCTGDCSIDIYNLKQIERSEKFEGLAPKDKNFFKSLDIYLNYTGGKIQFRNFSNISSWQGEIKSKEAAGGKVGGGSVSNSIYSASNGRGFLPDQREVLDTCTEEDKRDIKNLYNKYKKISLIKGKMKEDEFTNSFLSAPLGNKTSNYMNIELLYLLDQCTEQEKDKFIQSVIGHAKSETNISSVFVKVS